MYVCFKAQGSLFVSGGGGGGILIISRGKLFSHPSPKNTKLQNTEIIVIHYMIIVVLMYMWIIWSIKSFEWSSKKKKKR